MAKNYHNFDNSTAHNKEIYAKFCDTASNFDENELLCKIIESYLCDEELADLTAHLQNNLNENKSLTPSKSTV